MPEQRHVRLFRNGRNQAVRIPREFELPGKEAIMRREGDRLVLEPIASRRTLGDVLDSLGPIEDIMEGVEDPPPEPFEL